MKEFIEKLIGRLEETCDTFILSKIPTDYDYCAGICHAIEIVNELAEEHNGGWIPCSERLPEESGEYLTFVNYDDDEFIAIDEFDCEGIMTKWNCTPNYHVIAWQPLPPAWKGE